jgi:hypothetical protein
MFERPQPAAPEPEPRNRKRSRPLLLVAIIVIAALGVAAFIVFTGDGDAVSRHEEPPASLEVPGAFTGDAQPFEVTLTWSADPAAAGYTLFRDGERLDSVPAGQTTFTDDGVLPLQGFTYEIESFAGDVTSERAAVEVQTPAAPFGEARVEGPFRVIAHDTRSFGFVALKGDFRTGWRFRPTCAEGPCDVAWSDVNVRGFASVLARRGASYSGSDEAPFGSCGGRTTDATWTIRFRVTRAATLEGAWRATAFRGTIVQRSAPQLSCVATGADYTIKGTFAP